MLSTRDLDLMRDTQKNALPDFVTIKRDVPIQTGYGAIRSTGLTTIATQVPFRLDVESAAYILDRVARQIQVERYIGNFPIGTDLRDADVIEQTDGTQYRAGDVRSRHSWDTVLTAELERIE